MSGIGHNEGKGEGTSEGKTCLRPRGRAAFEQRRMAKRDRRRAATGDLHNPQGIGKDPGEGCGEGRWADETNSGKRRPPERR